MHPVTEAMLQKVGLEDSQAKEVLGLFNKADAEAAALYAASGYHHTSAARDDIFDSFVVHLINKASSFWNLIELRCDETNNPPSALEDNRVNLDVYIAWKTGVISQYLFTYHRDE